MVTVERLEQLEKENKNLKEKYKELSKENRRLILENADLMWERDGLKRVVERLHKEIETLELWLDNKEKLNEEYRKQIDMLRMRKEELDENCYWLAKENDELKKKTKLFEWEYKHIPKKL